MSSLWAQRSVTTLVLSYMVQLNSRRTRKVLEKCNSVIPYTSFCLPVIDAAFTNEAPSGGVPSA